MTKMVENWGIRKARTAVDIRRVRGSGLLCCDLLSVFLSRRKHPRVRPFSDNLLEDSSGYNNRKCGGRPGRRGGSKFPRGKTNVGQAGSPRVFANSDRISDRILCGFLPGKGLPEEGVRVFCKCQSRHLYPSHPNHPLLSSLLVLLEQGSQCFASLYCCSGFERKGLLFPIVIFQILGIGVVL